MCKSVKCISHGAMKSLNVYDKDVVSLPVEAGMFIPFFAVMKVLEHQYLLTPSLILSWVI